MKITVLSPHVDDAVFSLAESMLTWIEDGHEVTVLSVFAGIPWHDEEDRRKHTVLRKEHDRAMAKLGAGHVELELYDDAARLTPLTDEKFYAVRLMLWQHLERQGCEVLVRPSGITHPDHELTASFAVFNPIDGYQPDTWWYDEIPYYVRQPHKAVGPPYWNDDKDWTPAGYRSHYGEKQRLVSFYRSQLNEDLMRCLFVPERVWC